MPVYRFSLYHYICTEYFKKIRFPGRREGLFIKHVMKNDQITDKVITLVLDHDVKPGDHAGGSGHLSYVSYSIKDVSKKQIEDNFMEIICLYDKYIVTEFTYEPDNPPYRSSHEKCILLTFCDELDNRRSVKETDSETFRNQINQVIEYYLVQIEQGYGDCRAPVKFPPYYYSEYYMNSGTLYFCFIDVDLGGNETLAFISFEPDSMKKMIKNVFENRFGHSFETEISAT